MTSTADSQNSQAPNSSAAAPSYASAAGASKKQSSTPLIATGSTSSPVVVGGSSAHNAKPSGPSSLNGRPAITPAVPATPHGLGNNNTNTMNGASGDHSRKSSVTMSANGPNNYGPNGAAAAAGSKAPSSLKFGFDGSPAIAHSSPHVGSSAPINIQGANGPNQRVPSPAHSPSPIPQQPIASGGRPPSVISQQNTQMTFGSLGSEGDRHMRQGSVPPQNPAALASQAGAHIRRESAVSQHSDMSGAGGRPNFGHQAGRGRGGPGFNPQHQPQYNNNNVGFPPTNYARPGATGRGGPAMPPPFQPGRPMAGYPNSPGPGRSPALAHAQPGLSQPGTPNMGTIHPAQMGTPPSYHYGAPMPQPQYPYPPYGAQFDPRQHAGYAPQPFMGQGPAGSPGANFHAPQYTPTPYHAAAPQAMSRTSSHSDRPPSSTGQASQPIVVSSNQPQNGQQKGALANSFRPPKRSAAIVIKNAAGEAIDFSSMKAPASPSPSIQQSKTPPVAAATPPPSQKPVASIAHARNESQSTPKTAKEIQEELRAKIMAAAHGDDKPKEEAAAKPKVADEKPAETQAAPAAEVASKEPEQPAKATPEPKKEEPAAPVEQPKEAAAPVEDEEDELERQIREMEELEAQREKEAAEYEAKKKAKLEEQKKQEAANKTTSAAEADKKLRDAEAEAERLEEEKEKRRAAAEASGVSVADILKGKATLPEAPKVDDVSDKLASLSIGKDSKASTAEKPRAAKPPALNLAPLNTKPVEPPQPSAALQSLKSARFLTVMKADMYPTGIQSPNPALNAAVAKKGKAFKYDAQFLLQFQKVFTEQPSMEFHQQVKSLIGDNDGSRSASTPRPGNSRQASRSGAFPPSQQNMGSFASARGTTSAERFARANAAMTTNGAPAPGGGMGSFGRTGSFPMGAPSMSRSASSANMAAPNSPRTGSRRGPSRRGGDSARDAQAAKNMPLTAGMDLKPITVSASGWKPMSLKGAPAAPAASTNMEPEMVQRKVKSNLNKMTPEKFDKIADQILVIVAQSKNESDGRTLRQVIQLTFEKATDEAHWASMYAKFCKRMLDTMSTDIRDENLKDKNGETVSGGALFRKYLLNRCQEEFERGWKVNLPEKPTEEAKDAAPGEAAMLSDEYYIAATAKRRGLGLVQFIGELYKLGMLTERIMHACVQKLVDYETMPEEAEIESLVKLVRTIGANMDASPRNKAAMDAYFTRIQSVIDMPDLPSRLKFMLMDLVDLRRKGWETKEANKGPKTLDEVRAEAEAAAAAKAQESARGNQRGPPGGRSMGRGDSRSYSNYQQQNSNQVGMDDLRRLKGGAGRAAGTVGSLGPTSMFSSRSNSRRGLGPGGSLGRPGEDSGASSRTGTPPTTHTNAFSALANLDSENPASPPSTAASPALSKTALDSAAGSK
ncbi:eukaryotic initiation factor 4F subunit p130 [Plectosphaerella plurivora]|uniref:Eukaryotic initiation factor 4F subunit p130 n=1 Tax=Plectosphaerella plurivora TaxID=936078 RepID=A0A9P8VBT3_9PEZI|nr:eukaryotic initiation factor 4F subunit p130 [Plectosphaerella plurivora]